MTSEDEPDRGLRRRRFEAALAQSGRIYAESLQQLEECNRSLARLVVIRIARPWSDAEHADYLLLRRSVMDLNVRVQHAQRAFEATRARLRDFGQPF